MPERDALRDLISAPKALLLLALLAIATAFTADLSVYTALADGKPRGALADFFNATEAFGNGFGVLMIVAAVVTLDPTRRVQTSRLLAASLGAGLVADVVKLTISRTRPHALASGVDTVWETFTGVLPLASAGSAGQSFPSAHTACAFGLATALAVAYPRGSRLFFGFATGVALQRVCVNAHYVSDVVAGGFLGAGWAYAVFRAGALCRGFDRMEAWWSGRFGWPLPEGHGALEAAPGVFNTPPVERRRAA